MAGSDSQRWSIHGLDKYSGIIVWLFVVGIFALWIPHTFLTWTTGRSIASEQAITALVALAALVPLAAGHFDLSIGAVLGFTSVLYSWLVIEAGVDGVLAAVITLACGMLIGVVNAFVVVVLRVGSFIATLAMGTFLGSLVLIVSGGRQIVGDLPPGFAIIGQGVWFGLGAPVYWLIIVAIVLYYLLEHTPVGRYIYATGANPEAAALSGVRTNMWAFSSFLWSAGICSLAGIVYLAKIGSASLTAGAPYLLPAFAALFLGATQIKPGWPNVAGTLVAIVLLATGVKGLELTPLFAGSQWIGGLFYSTALIVAVAVAYRTSQNRRRRMAKVALNETQDHDEQGVGSHARRGDSEPAGQKPLHEISENTEKTY